MLAEENCICAPKSYGCITFATINQISDWSKDDIIMVHEIGHCLGAEYHDDQFYDDIHKDTLIMWGKISMTAFIWSPKAREFIVNHNSDCLEPISEKGEFDLRECLFIHK